MVTQAITEDSPDRFTEDPTDDELLAVEMIGERMAEGLEKAGPFKYKSRKKVKGKWVYDYGEKKLVKKGQKRTYESLPGGRTVFQHINEARDFLEKHAMHLPKALAELKQIAGPDADVKGRTKTLQSALGKMVRKPKYNRADKLQDGSGLRATHRSIAGVKATVEKLKAKYKILDEDDYISKPQGDYRSHHLIIEGPGGLAMEVQVRTENQNTFADWCHDVYKPTNEKQAESRKHPDVKTYAHDMSEYFWALDQGLEPPPKPPCVRVVSEAFGCL